MVKLKVEAEDKMIGIKNKDEINLMKNAGSIVSKTLCHLEL